MPSTFALVDTAAVITVTELGFLQSVFSAAFVVGVVVLVLGTAYALLTNMSKGLPAVATATLKVVLAGLLLMNPTWGLTGVNFVSDAVSDLGPELAQTVDAVEHTTEP